MRKLFSSVDSFLQRYMPDPFVVAVLLTLASLVWATLATPPVDADRSKIASQIILYWGDGFWELAKFTLQMAMILLGGYVVAVSRPVKSLIGVLIGFVETPVQAVVFCTLISALASWINWGFGLVIGAIVAIEVGKKVSTVPFRLLVASSYSGFLVWHAGLSGSIPLAMNTAGGLSEDLVGGLVPLSSTTFSNFNWIALGAILILLPVVNLISLKLVGDEENSPLILQEQTIAKPEVSEPWINRSMFVTLCLFALAAFYLYSLQTTEGRQFKLDLNSINFVFFMLGMLLHGTPRNFIDAITEATPKIAPILIQYPLYAGIMAILRDSGLAELISQWFVDNSTAATFPLMTFYSAGLLNLLVPSGGGQWAVQAPIVIDAATQLDVSIPKVAMAVAWGDAWTNMLQPFWAVPLLTIAGLSIKDIIGFCLLVLISSGLVLSGLFLLL